MGMLTEFKEFAMKGNVIDLAVGVVIGGAFGKIVSSLVDAIIMPLVGVLTGGVNFASLALTIGQTPKGEPVLLKYGAFLQALTDFVIIAFVIFVAVKAINRMQRPAPDAAAPAVPPQEALLAEIRDLLAARR